MRKVMLVGLLILLLMPGGMSMAQDDAGSDEASQTDTCQGFAFLDSWMRPMETAGGNTAAYLYLANVGVEDDVLIEATSTAAEAVELHTMMLDGDVMSMEPVSDGLLVPAGDFVALQPGGLHLMLIGLTEPLNPGDDVTIDLTFENSGTFSMTAVVPTLEAIELHEAGGMPVPPPSNRPNKRGNRNNPPLMRYLGANQFALTGCDQVQLIGGWARPNAGLNSAAYGLLINPADEAVVLSGGASEAFEAVEFHTMFIGADDVMIMQPVEGGLTIPPGGFLLLKPGGLHMMLINGTDMLAAGDTLDLSLETSTGDLLDVTLPVREPDEMPMGDH